jgi:hypothetical protein
MLQEILFTLTVNRAVCLGFLYNVYMLMDTNNGAAMRQITVTFPPHKVEVMFLTDLGSESKLTAFSQPYCASTGSPLGGMVHTQHLMQEQHSEAVFKVPLIIFTLHLYHNFRLLT